MNKGLRVALIANNFGKTYDGIGNYASVEVKYFPKQAEVQVFTAYCHQNDNPLKKTFNRGMSRAIDSAIFTNKDSQFDIFLVEYPFVEWNPFVIFKLKILKKQCSGIFVLSLHEYTRVNRFRKIFIRRLCKLADSILVSNNELKEEIVSINPSIKLREIPSNVFNEEALAKPIERFNNQYVYFGLVNSSKAFNELIEAWDIFNVTGDKTLNIITSSILRSEIKNHKGIKYIYNANDYDIILILRKCKYAILPIKPYIDGKNGSFKTCVMCGCEVIGHFQKDPNLVFIHSIDNYEPNSIYKGLVLSQNSEKSNNILAQKFGERYKPANICSDLYCKLLNIKEN